MEAESKPHRRPRLPRTPKEKEAKPHWMLEFLRHPLTVLFVGTVISSLAIPWLNARSSRAQQIEVSQQQKALEILKNASLDNARLNSLRSAFNVFEKEGGLTGSADLVEERRTELRKRVYETYEEFEQSAWWWYWEIGREAELFGWLPKSAIPEFHALGKQYQDNLYECSVLIQRPWKRYLSDVNETASEKKQALMPSLEASLGSSQAQRDEICAKMVRLFLK